MYYYSPKLHHAMITAAICLLLIASGAYTQKARILTAFTIGAWIFGFMTLVVLWMLIVNTLNERIDSMTELAKAYGQLDDEGRAAFAFQFPTMRYRMKRGDVREFFEDTNVPIKMFHEFLKTSNAKYISPERDWNSNNKPRWAWLEIKEHLEGQGYVQPESAAGSHSWLWVGESWEHLTAYWGAGIHLNDANNQLTQTRSVS